ncbi:MAG: MFS transporter [Chloroflexi bacterium]|nr:MFS transporter [Chloroflexota bacterium]
MKIERWQRTLYILVLAQLMTAAGIASIFPFLPLFVESLGTNTNMSLALLSGWVFSAPALTSMIASPIWGILADRYGRKIMVERALFGGAIMLFLMTFVKSAEQLIFLRAIQGAITGTMAAASTMIISVTPRQRTGYALGLLQVGFGAGIAVGPMVGGVMADMYGYRSAFYITALMLFLAGVIVLFGIQEQFKATQSSARQRVSIFSTWQNLLNTSGVMQTYVLRFFSSLGRMMMLPIIPLFIRQMMPNTDRLNTFTGLVLGVASASMTLSAVILGRLGDRIGHRKVLIVCAASLACFYALQGQVTIGWQLLVLQALAGFSTGGVVPMISALLANRVHKGAEGAAFGLDNSINAAGRAVAPILGGAIATWLGMPFAFVATGVIFIFVAMMTLWGDSARSKLNTQET